MNDPEQILTYNQNRPFENNNGPNPVFCAFLRKVLNEYSIHRSGEPIVISGAENLPQDGAFLVTPNHISAFDTGVVGHAVYESAGRYPNYMAKSEYWDGPFGRVKGKFVELGGGFPVKRKKPFDQQVAVVDHVNELLEGREEILVVYPQGTREKKETPVVSAQGLCRIILQSGGLVVPTGIAGTDTKRHMTVVFGKPFSVDKIDFDLTARRMPPGLSGSAKSLGEVLSGRIEEVKTQAEEIQQSR